MKRLCKAILILVLTLKFVAIGGQTEVQPDLENQLKMHYVGFGTSVGKNVVVPVGSQTSFGCAFVGDAAVESMQWKLYEHAGCTNHIDVSKINIEYFGDLVTTFDRTRSEECFAYYEGRFSTINQSGNVSSIIRIDDIKTVDERPVSCEFYARNFHGRGMMKFQLKVFSLPTVYVEDHPYLTDDVAGNQRTKVCSMKNIYPAPDNDLIGFYSTKTNKELDTDEVVIKVDENSDGTFDVRKYFTFTAEMMHHNESYYCIVEMLIGNTTMIRSKNSTSPTMVEHPTIDVKLTFHPNPVKDGEEAQVICESDGYPITSITIYQTKAFHQIATWNRSDSNNIQFNFIANKSMEGNYICQANNVISTEYLKVKWSADDIKLWKDGEIYEDDRDIKIAERDNLTLNCAQEGSPQPLTTWDITMDGISYIKFGDSENGIVIRNTTIADSGIYRCTTSLGLKRGIKVIVGTCKPRISVKGRKFDNGLVALKVTCSKQDNNSPCNLKLGTEYDVATEPLQVNEMSSISKVYYLNEIDEHKQFWCKTSTSKGFELFTVYKTVDDLSTTIHTNTHIGVLVMILIGCFLIVFIIYLTNHLLSCSCQISRRPDNLESRIDQPSIDDVELEPMDRSTEVDTRLHGEDSAPL